MTTPPPIPLTEFVVSTAPVREATSLPPDCYVSPEFFEFEKDVIFGREWLCVGRVEQVPEPGDYISIEIANEPLVVARKHDGFISVLSAVCQHRGAIIGEGGSGNCGKHLRCPYHWWSYDLDGVLKGAPQMHETVDFTKSNVRLPKLAVEVWNGFIFANMDPEAEPLAPRLAGLDEILAPYGLAALKTTEQDISTHQFNWKLMVENGIEPYHATYLHHRRLDAPKERHYVNPGFDDDSGAIVSFVVHGLYDLALNPTYKPYFPVIEGLGDTERQRLGFATVPPNLMLGWQSDMLFWFLLLPNRVDETDFRWGYLLPESTFDVIGFDDLLRLAREGIKDYNNEDLPIAEAMQKSMRSRWAPRGRYSHEEEVLQQFNRWLVLRYGRGATPES